jgi:hypothetical protein
MQKSKAISVFLMLCLGLLFLACPFWNSTNKDDRVQVVAKDFLKDMLQDLRKGLPTGETYRVVVGNFVFGGTDATGDAIPSPFAQYLNDAVLAVLPKCGFTECTRKELNSILPEHKLSISEVIDPNTQIRLRLSVAQKLITGRYWLAGEEVELYLTLRDFETAEGYTTTQKFSLDSLPTDVAVAIQPSHYPRTVDVLKIFKEKAERKFPFQVWVDRGKGAVYKQGEQYTVYARSEKDCYLKVYCLAASGDVQLIYPKSDKGFIARDQIHPLAQLKIRPPFGTELLKAVASTGEFRQIEPSGKVLGKIQSGEELEKIRGKDSELLDTTGEVSVDICVFTSVENK